MVKIKSIEYFRVKPRWLFVKIEDEESQVGWGEGTLEGHSLAVEGALDEIISRIVGYEAEYETSFRSGLSRLTIFAVTLNISGS